MNIIRNAVGLLAAIIGLSFIIPFLVKGKNISEARSTDDSAYNPRRRPDVSWISGVGSACRCESDPCVCAIRFKPYLGSAQKPFSTFSVGGGEI